ncbi:MAG: hypothetical protein ABSF47_01315 [Minisyncoccia bacterium]|jgi:hypothetical protein
MKDKRIIFLLPLLAVDLLLFNVTLAFTGPGTLQPGSGGGLLFSSSTYIGIGTTNPAVTLHVVGGVGGINIARFSRTNGATTDSFFSGSGGSSFVGFTDNASVSWSLGSDNGDSSKFKISKSIDLGSNYYLTIDDANGNVGIATTSPTYPLTVNGSVYSTGNFIGGLSGTLTAGNITGPTAFGATFQTAPPVGYVYAFPQALAVGTTTVAGLQTNMLFAAGNVGIGTTAPVTKLDVSGAITARGANPGGIGANATVLDFSGGTARWFSYGPDASTNGIFQLYSQRSDGTNNIIPVTILGNGNVGIGTTGPGGMLHVRGNGVAQPMVIVEDYSAASNPAIQIKNDTTNWFLETVGARSNNFEISHGGGAASNSFLAIQTNGNVGIATTTPKYPLSVNGSYYSVELDKGNSGAAITIDWSAGNTQHVILTSGPGTPVALTFTNPQPGARYTLILKQDGTGGRTVTWPATFRTGSAGPITLSTAPNATDYVGLQYNGVDGKYDNVAFNAGF